MVIAAQYFELNNEGKAELKHSESAKTQGMELVLEVKAGGKKKLLEAAQACPAQAISILDESGNKVY